MLLILGFLLGGFFQFFGDFAQAVVTFWSFAFMGFWGVVVLLCLIWAYQDHYWPIGILLFVVLAFLFIAGAIAPIAYAIDHPWKSVGFVILYLVIGLVWAVIRYLRFLKRKVQPKRDEKITEFLGDVKLIWQEKQRSDEPSWAGMTEEILKGWSEELLATRYAPIKPDIVNTTLNTELTKYLVKFDVIYSSCADNLGTATDPPSWQHYKRDYYAYFAYWPFDMVIYALGDLLKDILDFLSKYLGRVIDSMARQVLKGKVRNK